MYLALVSAFFLLMGWAIGDSVDYPFTGLGVGISLVLALLVFLGDDDEDS